MSRRLAALLIALPLLALAACGGSSSPTAPSDFCQSSIDAAIQDHGTPDSRTDSGNMTVIYWGHMHITFTRDAQGCFFTNPTDN
jgi:hypothetical protein